MLKKCAAKAQANGVAGWGQVTDVTPGCESSHKRVHFGMNERKLTGGRSFAISEDERGAAEAAPFSKPDLGESSIRNSATGSEGYSYVMLLLRSVQKTSYCSKSWTAKEVRVRFCSLLEGVARPGTPLSR